MLEAGKPFFLCLQLCTFRCRTLYFYFAINTKMKSEALELLAPRLHLMAMGSAPFFDENGRIVRQGERQTLSLFSFLAFRRFNKDEALT
ncbi:hypothetical protein A3Q36_10520 [Geobacillus stearothermophilus]|nr:hypothetical protein A3Q36_10520 [Geobacillus stearothermophilus]